MANINEPEIPKILVEFDAPNSVMFHVKMINVNPMMLTLVGTYLELHGKVLLNDDIRNQLEAQKQQMLAVPEPKILKPQ